MPIKCTMIFSQSSNKTNTTSQAVRVGGWSESHYWPDQNFANAITGTETLAAFRAWLITPACTITGLRFQQVSPAGPSQSLQKAIRGAYNILSDIPQMALQINIPAVNAANISRIKLRGIPDSRVSEGELSTTRNFSAQLDDYIAYLTNFKFHGRDLSLPAYPLVTIDNAGVFFTEEPTALAAGNMVRILRAQNSDGTFRGGRFQIATMTSLQQGQLRGWDGGPTEGGRIRRDGNAYFQYRVAAATIGRISTKKVGRPSSGYVGRRSNRK